jgi:pimeloyl-ACP methyl ester carboxylesterase
MSSTPTLPTILIIHDAWHTPTHYSRLIDQLHAAGFDVACPQLLTSSAETNNTSTFNDDTTLIYAMAFDLASDGRNILVLAHGYGGFLATEICGELSKKQRVAAGQNGGIVGIVYMAAWLPQQGASFKQTVGRGELPIYMPQNVCLPESPSADI